MVFILGTARSGSTWLNLVLGSCDWAANLGEYHRPWTFPGHTICRLCEADGLAECTLLGGYRDVAAGDAFHFAAMRTGKRCLIDASKWPQWTARFLGREDIDARLVHLVRHPCGFVESQRRRTHGRSDDALLEDWVRTNRELEDYALATGAPATLVAYEELANHPARAFPALCDWLGHPWQPAALEYWKVPHHGLGGNGAASLYLKGRRVANYQTGDDAFYADMQHRASSADDRWRERLSGAFKQMAVQHPYTLALHARLGGEVWRDE